MDTKLKAEGIYNYMVIQFETDKDYKKFKKVIIEQIAFMIDND